MKNVAFTIKDNRPVFLGDCEGEIGDIYYLPLDLDTITIGQSQVLLAYLVENAKKEYLDFMANTGESPTEEMWSSELDNYTRVVCRAIATMLGLPLDLFETLDLPQRRAFVDVFELSVIRPLFAVGLYEPRGIEEFTLDDVVYKLPASRADGFGGKVPMANITAEEYAENNDLMLCCRHFVEMAHLSVAILCRPEGEKYDELVARERGEKFKALPVSVAFEVFFCKLAQTAISAKYTTAFITKLGEKMRARIAARTKTEEQKSERGTVDCSTSQVEVMDEHHTSNIHTSEAQE